MPATKTFTKGGLQLKEAPPKVKENRTVNLTLSYGQIIIVLALIVLAGLLIQYHTIALKSAFNQGVQGIINQVLTLSRNCQTLTVNNNNLQATLIDVTCLKNNTGGNI